MRIMTDIELTILCTVVRAELVSMEAENQDRLNGGFALAYPDYNSDNYDLLCEQLEIVKSNRAGE